MVLKQHYRMRIDDLELEGVGTFSGLETKTKHKIVHDNASNSRPRVIVGAEAHENVVIKCNVLSLSNEQASKLTEKRNNHRKNDDSDDSKSQVSFSFYLDAEHNEDAGQYLCTGCKIVGLKLDDGDRENEADPLMMEIEFAVAEGGWSA